MASPADLEEIFERHIGREGPLLPILHDVQSAYGCVSEDVVIDIAQRLNLTRAEVHGVVSFYHDFKRQRETQPEVHLCRAEACKARGIEGLLPAAEAAARGRVKLSAVYCLGLCSVGPSARIGGRIYARLDEAGLVRLIENA